MAAIRTMLAKCAEINEFHMGLFAYYLEKLKATPDGDGNLLDHSVLLYGSGMCDADKHDHTNLPIVVAGGKPKAGGRYMKYRRNYTDGEPASDTARSRRCTA